MHRIVLLCLVAIVSSTQTDNEPNLPYTVLRYNYELPSIPLSEGRATNDALYFVRFPQYSLSIRMFCPYELIEKEFLTYRNDDPDHCISKVDLTYWSKEHRKTITLDSYNILRNGLHDRDAVNSITVYKAPEGNTHFVTLAMADKTCRKMEYKVGDELKITTEEHFAECKEVEQLDIENDEWVKEHVVKAINAAKEKDEAKDTNPPIITL